METAHSAQQGGNFRRLLIFGALTLGLLALIASSVTATSAYFSDTEVRSTVISTGEVDISLTGLGNGILDFDGSLMPGESVSDSFTITNNAPADGDVDLYVWVEFGNSQPVDLCGSIDVSISGPSVPSAANSNDICDLAADLDGSLSSTAFGPGSAWPLKLNGTNALTNQRTYTVTLTMETSAGNELASFTSDGSDQLVVYATQAGAPAPDDSDWAGDYDEDDLFTQ